MVFENILYQVTDDVATLTLNRPEVSNGFNIPMCEEILKALDLVDANEDVHFLIIKGEGKVFSVGGDLAEMQRAVEADDVQSLVKIAELVNVISFKMKKLPKPVILVADGPVAGAAANMVVAADFCIASEKARFIQAFVGVGLAPDAGGLYLLTRAIGVTRATHLVMTGEALTAEKALEYGLLYRLSESEKLQKTVDQLLKKLKRGSINSYRAMKEMVWQSLFTAWDEYAALELNLQKSLAFTDDFKEGVRAYGERRRPKFTGK
ncbi:enoyl-CoA hydratase [Streptococcus massiliensis]|uniref:Enoyl-CoA hydratase n=1 Tax=Streptococcus massiliensis TaxID=313439 RepID=A0A380L0T9_9STRE|nr:enoyl-CoA hydratase [Streptococcus massiliensis]SUN77170.1 enoyl-CoA hydratase [Streptococcus massiliensis]